VVGPVIALGSRGAEARGLLRALELAGEDVAARTITPTWIGPILDEEHWRALYDVHFRPARPDAMTVSFAGEEEAADASILRLGGPAASRPRDAIAWVASPAVRDRLREQGWPDHAIELVAPAAIDAPLGEGGAGVLVWLPTHNRSLAAALLAGLRDLPQCPIRVIPSVRTPDLQRALREAVPHAELLPAITNERLVAAVAGNSDLVIALDPSDEFDRIALTAAGAGAAVVVRPGGPAAWVLGDLALTVDPSAPDLALGAVGRGGFDASATARAERSEAVSDACGPAAAADALGRLLSSLRTASR
jgi:hypothetical protein